VLLLGLGLCLPPLQPPLLSDQKVLWRHKPPQVDKALPQD
jgi:hypothetical protein